MSTTGRLGPERGGGTGAVKRSITTPLPTKRILRRGHTRARAGRPRPRGSGRARGRPTQQHHRSKQPAQDVGQSAVAAEVQRAVDGVDGRGAAQTGGGQAQERRLGRVGLDEVEALAPEIAPQPHEGDEVRQGELAADGHDLDREAGRRVVVGVTADHAPRHSSRARSWLASRSRAVIDVVTTRQPRRARRSSVHRADMGAIPTELRREGGGRDPRSGGPRTSR